MEQNIREIDKWMEAHLRIATFENDNQIRDVGVQDPFHTTIFEYKPSRLQLFLQLVGIRSRITKFRVHVRADSTAVRRWFGEF